MVPVGCLSRHRLEQLCDLLATLAALELHHAFSRVIVHRSNAVILVRLPRRRDHHLLALGTPHRPQGWEPAQIKLIG